MREIIENFINQYNRPFTVNVVAEMTALEIGTVKPIIKQLIKDKTLKYIDAQDGIMVRNNRFNPVVCYQQKGDWRFNQAAASALLDVIDQGKYTSIRSVARACGRSRQWSYVYMEALASVGCIGMDGKQYVVISRDRLSEIGKYIEQGILGRMRPKISVEEKRILSEEKELRRQEQLHRAEAREQISAATEQKGILVDAYFDYLLSGDSWRVSFKSYLRQKGLE